jgi:hypothetical protein
MTTCPLMQLHVSMVECLCFVQAAPADAADAAGESSFLRCVTLLNDDVLTAYLLPKLVEQGSAGAVAATCASCASTAHST